MIAVSELRAISLFDGLTDTQLGELVAVGDEVAIEPGVVLFREGDHADFWWVLLDGTIDLVRHVGREDVVVRQMQVPGVWAGGFRAWDEHGVYLATGRGAVPGRLLRVPADKLQALSGRWFPFAVHLVEGLYSTARSIESTARQRESLVTLGTLAAGLAHEINNPAAAATRSVDALRGTSGSVLAYLRHLADSEITAAQFQALDSLRMDLQGRSAVQDPLARADQEDALSSFLTKAGVPQPWLLAPALVGAGADRVWCDRVEEAVGREGLGAALHWVASTVATTALLAELKVSIGRISELVAAVKSFSQLDRGSRQRIDLRDGIEASLVVLGHKLGDGISVVRAYAADTAQIEAYAGELNQVWANLLDNAIDAMDGAGTLRIATRAQGETVVVDIEDTGPGMPPEVVARAFEPFFTTKDVGKGTGLGLDIVRRIVEERHGGTVTIDSEPGRTVFRVRLPAVVR